MVGNTIKIKKNNIHKYSGCNEMVEELMTSMVDYVVVPRNVGRMLGMGGFRGESESMPNHYLVDL